MNQLLTALEAAAQRHGAPVIGSHAGRAGYFPALIFGDDHKFVPGGDRTVIYEFTGNGQPAIPHNWRDIGTRDNELDAMAAHVETYLAERAAPVRDEYSAEWLDALARADAQQSERAPVVPESTQLYQWLITYYAINLPGDADVYHWTTDDGATVIGYGARFIYLRDTGLTVSVMRSPLIGCSVIARIDEALTGDQITEVSCVVYKLWQDGRIGKEAARLGPAMERPYAYSKDAGWAIERVERAAAASNFKYWYMARGIVISAHEAAAVAAQEARA